MDSFDNKTAFITGAASGLGLAFTQALVAKGANVMMADMDAQGLDEYCEAIKAAGGSVASVVCDVTKLEDVKAAAKATQDTFGSVHLVFNNAGVSLSGNPGTIAIPDWQWIVDINLMGVVNGVETFVPILRAQGEGGHVINTASMAGHFTMPYAGPYHATKYAVVGYSEGLQQELKPDNIGVSVLCPTWIKSKIYASMDERPTSGIGPDIKATPAYAMAKAMVENGMEPSRFAELVLKSIQVNRLYVFNDPEVRHAIDLRRDAILADFDACLADLDADS